MVTIQNIAEETGVSASTVSRALSGHTAVSREVTLKIQQAADLLGYQKRRIKRHKSRAILNVKVILPAHEDPARLLFFDLAELFSGLREGLSPCSTNLIFGNANPNESLFPHKKGGHVDAVIFAFCDPWEEALEELEERSCAFYILNRSIPQLPCIFFDDQSGMRSIVRHLNETEANLKIAYIALNDFVKTRESRREALLQSCNKYNLPFDTDQDVYVFKNIDTITAEAMKELSSKYNAFVCMNDITAHIVQISLLELGIKIPQDIQVTGYDDSPMRHLTRPLLTSVSLEVGELARRAGQALNKQLIEKEAPDLTLCVKGELVIGASTRHL